MKKYVGLLKTPVAVLLATSLWTLGCDDTTGASETADIGGGDSGADTGLAADSGPDTGVAVPCFNDNDCSTTDFCRLEENALEGICSEGCRDGSCDDGQACNLETRICDTIPCAGDGDCDAGEYCKEDGTCDADPCPIGDPCEVDGAAGQCDASRVCQQVFACCAADNSCSMAAADACEGLQFQAANVQCIPGLCEAAGTECAADGECEDGAYCNVTDGLCVPGCRTDDVDACPADQVCDPFKRTCEDQPCDTDADCPEQMYCDPDNFLCRTGCREDACDEGEQCDLETRECSAGPCAADDDCVAPQYCDEDLGICRPPCEAHDECGAGEFCDDNSECVSGCRDDAYEQNDVVEDASLIELEAVGVGARVANVRGDIVLCPEDADVWRIDLDQGERMRVEVRFPNEPVTYAVNLSGNVRGEDIEGLPLAEEGLGDRVVITFPPVGISLDAATYFLSVAAQVDDATPYEIQITAQGTNGPDGECFRDPRDLDGTDDSPAEAFALPPQGGDVDGSICGGDEDWFSIPLAINDGIEIEVLAVPGSDPISVILISDSRTDNPGNPQFRVDVGNEIPEGTSYTISVPEQQAQFSDELWYIRLKGVNPQAIAEYRMTVNRLGVAACEDDAFEPNNNIAGGTDLDAIEAISADGQVRANTQDMLLVPGDTVMCPLDVDVYCLELGADNGLQVTVSGDGVAGAIHYEIVDENGARQGQDGTYINGQDVQIAGVFGPPPGRYCVRVDGLEAAQGPYELHIRRQDGLQGCAADLDEADARNDSPSTATQMPDVSGDQGRRFEVLSGLLCDENGNDEDWYRFDVATPDSRVCVMVNGFENARADIDAELYPASDPEGLACQNHGQCAGGRCIARRCVAPIAVATSNTDAELMNVPKNQIGPRNGEHLIRVMRGADGARQPYRVTATVEPEQDCVADWQELGDNNDDMERATILGSGHSALCDTWVCANERLNGDWYELTIPAGEDRTVLIDFESNTDGRLFMQYEGVPMPGGDPFEAYRASEDSVGNYQCINIAGGSVDLEVKINVYASTVRDDGDDRVDYNLRVVPTDLDADARGACLRLGAGDFPACPEESPFDLNCWPWHQLP